MAGPSLLAESYADPTASIINSKEQPSPVKDSVSYPKIKSSGNTPRAALASSITINYHGFIKHMPIKQHPRLITEVIRGTPRYQKLRSLRPASERLNSTAKDDLKILDKPRLRGLKRAAILAQLTLMAILLKRVAQFIIKVTLTVRKERIKNPYGFIIIRGPKVPKFILNLVQRE